MRQIFLDTETTGLNTYDGHRIIEIGCIEMVNRRITERQLHLYINPQRAIDEGAIAVHGITLERLADEPKFADIAQDFLDFVKGAELIIHNAAFDMGFLEYEFSLLGLDPLRPQLGGVIDTLVMAKQMFPGKRKSLDALCERFEVSNAHRVHHGALLDAGLLADVYLAMTRGQDSLEINIEAAPESQQSLDAWPPPVTPIAKALIDFDLHRVSMEQIAKAAKGGAVWSVH